MNDQKDKPDDNSEAAATAADSGASVSKQPSLIEWILATAGLLLIVSVLGFIIYSGATRDHNPPEFSFEEVAVKPSGDRFLVTFKVKNTGDETAAAVNVEGALKNGDQAIETSDATIAYVPTHSWRETGLIFAENPHNYKIDLQVKGYEKP